MCFFLHCHADQLYIYRWNEKMQSNHIHSKTRRYFRFATVTMGGTVSRRQLGKHGPKVSAIGFGAMGLSPFHGAAAPDEERFKVLDRAIELGSTYIDSADIYGDNEELLAKYFKKYPQQRKKVI